MTYLRFQNSFVQISILWLIIDYSDLFINEYRTFLLEKIWKGNEFSKTKSSWLTIYKSIKRKNKLFKLFVTSLMRKIAIEGITAQQI